MDLMLPTTRRYSSDPIRVSRLTLPETLMCEMLTWKESVRRTFEALLILTSGGGYCIQITENELAKFARVSIAHTHNALDFLQGGGHIQRDRFQGGRMASKHWVEISVVREFNADFIVNTNAVE